MAQDPDDRILRERLAQRPVEDSSHHGDSHLYQESSVQSQYARRERQVVLVKRVIYFMVNAIAIFLGIRLLLAVLGAQPTNGFVQFINAITALFAAPFTNLFGPPLVSGDNVFDPGLLFGIFVYYIFAWLLVRVVTFFVLSEKRFSS